MHTESFSLHNSRVVREPASPVPEHVGKYRILERIDVGGMAEMFKATRAGSHGFEKHVALKRMLPHLAADPVAIEMFRDEARISAHLEHPRIVQAIELGSDAGTPYLVLEYVDGLDILTLLRECARTQIRLPATFAALIAREVVDALDYAHGATDSHGRPLHVVHRDVSPSNVLLAWNGDIKLTDFGVALAADRRYKTATRTLRGKYGYMSPEQVSGGKVDPRSDLFAVGTFLAEMVMARRLFTAASDLDVLLAVRDVNIDRIDAHAHEFPFELLGIVMRCLQRDPRDRWQSAAELREALDVYLEAGSELTARALASFASKVVAAPTVEVAPRLGRGSGSHPAVDRPEGLDALADDDEIVLDTRDIALFDPAELELEHGDDDVVIAVATHDIAPADVDSGWEDAIAIETRDIARIELAHLDLDDVPPDIHTIETRESALFEPAELDLDDDEPAAIDIEIVDSPPRPAPVRARTRRAVPPDAMDSGIVHAVPDEPATRRMENSEIIALDELALQRQLDQALAEMVEPVRRETPIRARTVIPRERAPVRFRQFNKRSQGDDMPANLAEELEPLPLPVRQDDSVWVSTGARLYAAIGGAFGVCVALAVIAMLVVVLV
ncbi:MAG TPA: serine/threonine-protein kinase [Kofleriaceae bacterium]